MDKQFMILPWKLDLVIAGILLTAFAGCSSSSSSFQVICGPLEGFNKSGFSDTGSEFENKANYKWKPVIRVDRSKGTLLWAVLHNDGKIARFPRMVDFKENSGVLEFNMKMIDNDHKAFLDTKKRLLFFSHYASEGNYWSESKAKGACTYIKSMPEIAYQ